MIKRILNLFKAKDGKQLYKAYCMAYDHVKVADYIEKEYNHNSNKTFQYNMGGMINEW